MTLSIVSVDFTLILTCTIRVRNKNCESVAYDRSLITFLPGKILSDQKQLEDVEYFKYLGSILTNDGKCTCEIKCRIAMAKAAFNKKRTLFLAHWTWN